MIFSLLKLYLLPTLILLSVFLICLIMGIPDYVFMADPLYLVDGVPWLGTVSNFGILTWCACVSICFFTAALLRKRGADKDLIFFLWTFASLTLLIMLDDLFMLHEYIFLKILHLHQYVLFGIYAALAAFGFIAYRKIILASAKLTLILAAFFFAISTGFDILHDYYLLAYHDLLEDGFKFLGIVSWAGYFIIFCFSSITSLSGKTGSNPKKP